MPTLNDYLLVSGLLFAIGLAGVSPNGEFALVQIVAAVAQGLQIVGHVRFGARRDVHLDALGLKRQGDPAHPRQPQAGKRVGVEQDGRQFIEQVGLDPPARLGVPREYP